MATLSQRMTQTALPYYLLAILLFILTLLLSVASQDSSVLNDLFLTILGFGFITLLLLLGLLLRGLLKLYRDFKYQQPGSRLTVRLVSIFVFLILISTSIVYAYSIHFLHRGINSWFDVQVEEALHNALELSRTALGIRIRTLLRQTRMMSDVLGSVPNSEFNSQLRDLTALSGAIDYSVWTMTGDLVTSSLQTPNIILPNKPSPAVFRQLNNNEDYINLEPDETDRLQLRAAVLIPQQEQHGTAQTMLFVSFPVNEQLSHLSKTVESAYTTYRELNYLRTPLINVFTLTLSLIVFLTVLASLGYALWLARRIVKPLQELAQGTQSVASGNYDTQLTMSHNDEIGFLVNSFNKMTHRLTQARDSTRQSHHLLEQQTRYLSAVLGTLSSGVITLGKHELLKTANVASSEILDVDMPSRINTTFDTLRQHPQLTQFLDCIAAHIESPHRWQQQIERNHDNQQQILICRGTPLPQQAGWVIVFDDITKLIQAQREAAWGEVARRLAHEIKNPLTPIQLSAERLQHKYEPLLPPDNMPKFKKLTQTIIQQVDAMKDMVNDFSDYARRPQLNLSRQSLWHCIKDVLTLYQGNEQHEITLLTPQSEDVILSIDSNRFRQVLHNLIKNAIEASEEAGTAVKITLDYHLLSPKNEQLQIRIKDHGPGIPDNMLRVLFEPYVTSKAKGTGLGLAIVKKIIDEHQGKIWIQRPEGGGTCVILQLPMEKTSV